MTLFSKPSIYFFEFIYFSTKIKVRITLRERYHLCIIWGHHVTPQTRGSVDYPSIRGIQVDVGLSDATLENRAESSLYGELYPNTTLV